MATKDWTKVNTVSTTPTQPQQTKPNLPALTGKTNPAPAQTSTVKPLSVSKRKDTAAPTLSLKTAQENAPKTQTPKPSVLAGRTPAQTALSTPVVLSGGNIVDTAQTRAQQGRKVSTAGTDKLKGVMTNEVISPIKQGVQANLNDSVKGKKPSEMYDSLTSYIGHDDKPIEFRGHSDVLYTIQDQLAEEYNTLVAPAYEEYIKKEEAYKNGTGSYEEYIDARNDYVDVYNYFNPRQTAWQKMNDIGSYHDFWRDSSLEDVDPFITALNTAIKDGDVKVSELKTRLDGAQTKLDSTKATLEEKKKALEDAAKAYKVIEDAAKKGRGKKGTAANAQATYDALEKAQNEYNKAYDDFVGAKHDYFDIAGQYDSEMYYLSELTGMQQYGVKTWKDRYLDENKWIAWERGEGIVRGDALSIQEKLKEYQQGGKVDLLNRPEVDAPALQDAGWKDADEGTATVYTSTYSNYDFMSPGEQRRTDISAANFTSIAVDEQGNVTILSPEELTEYARGVLLDGKPDELGIQIGTTFTGAEALSEATTVAQNIHTMHEVMINGDYTTDAIINDMNWIKVLDDIEDLRTQYQNTSNETKRAELLAQINHYENILGGGIPDADRTRNQNAQDISTLQKRISDAQKELDELAWVEDYQMLASTGYEPPIPEGHTYEEDFARRAELLRQQADAQKYIQILQNNDYELTYRGVLDEIPDDTRDKIEAYIVSGGEPENISSESQWVDLVNNAPQIVGNTVITTPSNTDEKLAAEGEIRKELADAGYTDHQIENIMGYVTRQANETRTNAFVTQTAAESLETSGLVNFLAQRALNMAGWEGAVSNAGQFLFGEKYKYNTRTHEYEAPDEFYGGVPPIDYYNMANSAAHASRAIGQSEYQRIFNWVNEMYGDNTDEAIVKRDAQIINNAYNLLGSMADSTITAMLGATGSDLGLFMMAGNAATNSMIEMHEQGYSDGAVLMAGIVSGLAEFYTEKIEMDNLLGIVNRAGTQGLTFGDVAKVLFKNANMQGLSEMSEEVVSNLVNTFYDHTVGQLLNGGLTQIKYNALEKQKADPNLKWDQAVYESWVDWVGELRDDALGGYLSGFLMAGAGQVANFAVGGNARQMGDLIMNGNLVNPHGDNSFVTYNFVQQLDETIAGQKAKIAAGLEEHIGTDTPIRVGRMTNGLMDARVMVAVHDRLIELGEAESDITPELLRAVNVAANGDYLTNAEKKALLKSKYGRTVMQELQDYRNEVQQAQEKGRQANTKEQAEWARDTEESNDLLLQLLTQGDIGANVTAKRANALELQFKEAEQNNPDAHVQTPIEEQLTEAGATPEVAARQGKILNKVFNGEVLTNKEMRALNLNDHAVHKVFVERSGMTGIPDGAISDSLKRTYVNQVTRESLLIKENQRAASEGTNRLADAARDRSAARTKALQDYGKRRPQNPFARLFDGKGQRANEAERNLEFDSSASTRVRNAQERQRQAQEEYERRRAEAARAKVIPTQGRSAGQIIDQVKEQSGNTTLLVRDTWANEQQAAGVTFGNSTAIDNGYRMYLENAGLTKAEITAMEAVSRMNTEGSAKNEVLRRDSGGRELGDNGRADVQEVSDREGKAGEGRTGTAFDLGIPNGAKTGSLQEVTEQEIKSDPKIRAARALLTQHGIPAKNIHFVRGNGDVIRIAETTEIDGKSVEVEGHARGLYDRDTQSFWVLVDDPSAARLTPYQTAKHELFHHLRAVNPELFTRIKARMEELGVLGKARELAAQRSGRADVANLANEDYWLEEIMGDAYANVNTFTGQNTKQFYKLVRDAVADVMLSSAADVVEAGPKDAALKASAIEITPEMRDSHHDDLGRKLTKGMDKFMENSFMREGLQDFAETGEIPNGPLMNMYEGGSLAYDEFPDGRLTFFSDRPEVSRTYSAGKGRELETTLVQEHTKARQKIAQLEKLYKTLAPLADISDANKAELKKVAQELKDLHREIEPFSKDIYAMSRSRDIVPSLPETVEDAKKLIDRYGAYNRSAKLVDVDKNPREAAVEMALPVLQKNQKAISLLRKTVNGFLSEVQDMNTEQSAEDVLTSEENEYALAEQYNQSEIEPDDDFDPVEAELGKPYWLTDEVNDINDLVPDALALKDLLDDVVDSLAEIDQNVDAVVNTLYDVTENLSAISSFDYFSLLNTIAFKGNSFNFNASNDLKYNATLYLSTYDIDWDNVFTPLARTMYRCVEAEKEGKGITGKALDVKGLGIKKFFNNDNDIIDYGKTLFKSLSEYGVPRGIYNVYLNITKPLVIDAGGKSYYSLHSLSDEKFPEKQEILDWKDWGSQIKSRDVAGWAMEQTDGYGNPRYDGVIILNVADTMGSTGASTVIGDKTSTVAITWNANVVKSTANTNPTNDSRITYSAIEDTDAAVAKAAKEFEWSENRSDELNTTIQRLVNGENVSVDEMLETIPEVIEAEKNSTRDVDVPEQPEWANEKEVALSNFESLGSYNSDAEGEGTSKWTGPIDKGRIAVFVVGPPAAGKSTIAVNELSELFHAWINDKDEYRRSFTGNKNGEDASFVEAPSGELRRLLRDRAIDRGDNVVYPTVGRSIKHLRDEAKLYKDKHYTLYIVAVDVDRNMSMARSLVRSFPSDGHKARYTNVSYADSSATSPRVNFDAALRETYTDSDGNTSPLFAGSALFDNSFIGKNAILVGESTIPGFRNGQKGSTDGQLDRGVREGASESYRSEPGGGEEGLRDSRLGSGDARSNSGYGGRTSSVLGQGANRQGRENGPNVSHAIRAQEAKAAVQRQNESRNSAKYSAVEAMNKAQTAVSVGGTGGVKYDHSKSFAQQIDDYKAYKKGAKNRWRQDDSLVVSETPQILRDIGLTSLPITYNEGHLDRVIELWEKVQPQLAAGKSLDEIKFDREDDRDHAFGPEVLKQLPKALADPIAIIRSQPTKKNPDANTKSITVYTEIMDNGKPVRAFITLNGIGKDNGRFIDAYEVNSVHRSSYAMSVLLDAFDKESKGKVVGVYYIDPGRAAKALGIGKKDVTRLIGQTKNLGLGISGHQGDILHRITDSKAEVKPAITDNTQTKQFEYWFKGILRDGDTPRPMYHVTDTDRAVKNGIGYVLTSTPGEGSREVYGRLARPLYLDTALPSKDAKTIIRQAMNANLEKMFRVLPEAERAKAIESAPARLGAIAYMKDNDQANTELVKYLKELGFDGLRYKGESGREYIVFNENQIKATDNTGLYSPISRNIRYSVVEETEEKPKTEKQRVKEAVQLERKVNSLPATAAMQNRRAVRRADQTPINDNQAAATPLPSPNKADLQLPKSASEFGRDMRDLKDKAYRAMVNATQELDLMSKLQTRTDNLSVWVNIVRGTRYSVERFYSDMMLDKQGNPIGPSMDETFLCYDENGKFDQQLQNALNDYMFYKHCVDRMSLKRRAIERVKAFEEAHPDYAEMSDKDFGVQVADGEPLALEYNQLLKEAAETEDKPVLADANGNPVTAESAQRVVDTYEQEMPWLIDKANDIYDWWDVFMREWAVGSSITESQYDHMRELYPHYVPTYRVNKGQHAGYLSGNATGISSGEVVKKAKGSTAPLQAMEDQFVQSMTQIVTNSRRNDLLLNLVEELMNDTEGRFADYGVYDWNNASAALKQDLWDLADAQDLTDSQDKASIAKVKINGEDAYHVSCWVDGVKMSAYVNRAMFEGLNFLFGRHGDAYNTIANIGRKLTQPMKNMITGYNLTFALKNVVRDQQTALANSCVGPITYLSYLKKAAAKMAQNDNDWINFQALGGVSSNETRVDGGFAKAMSPETGIKKALKKGAEWIGTPGELSESVSRFAEYLAALELAGGDTYENRLAAIRAAAEITVDFGRSGSWGRLINMWVPYWNANVQGLDKAIRNIKDQPDVKSMLKRTGRAMLVNIIPAAIQIALIKALHREKDYEELNDQQKDNYYCLPVIGKEHYFLKIPKSQDWGAFFSTPIIRIWEGVDGKDDPNESWFEAAMSGLDGYLESGAIPQLPFDTRTVLGVENVPVLMPIGLDYMLELAENKNWAGSDIVPYNLQEASAKEQYDADTSMLAYYFGQIFNGSPMQLDYIVEDYMGNFWGVIAKTLIPPFMSRGIVTGEAEWADKINDMVSTWTSPFVADNRYSNATMAEYYDMLDKFEREVTDAGAHGDKTTAEHYDIYQALTKTGGYVDQIRALTSEARTLTRGNEQANIKWEAAGLMAEAMEFVDKCLSGEIKDPDFWMTYSGYGEKIMNEAESLQKYETANGGGYNFSGALGKPTTIWDRSGDKDVKYTLKDNQNAMQEYARIRSEEYEKALNTVISSSKYKSAKPEQKAAQLEEAKKIGLEKADEKMLQYLKANNIKGETITKADYSDEKRAAAYSVGWLLGEDSAYKPALTDQFIDLYDYNDQYSFVPTDSTRKTFKAPGTDGSVYVLNSKQQKKYSEIYHDTVTEYYDKVMASDEYKNADKETRAAMLAKAKSEYVNDVVKAKFAQYLQKQGATATTAEKASVDITLEAKYAIQRIMGDDHAMDKRVTDELVKLYAYKDVGEVGYLPITSAPKSYVDDRDKERRYWWVLDEDQREMYMSIMYDTYQKNVLKVVKTDKYKKATDYEKAQMLCDVRDRLSGDVQSQFKKWLRDNYKPTLRTSPEEEARKADVKKAADAVSKILGNDAYSYKQFNQLYGY